MLRQHMNAMFLQMRLCDHFEDIHYCTARVREVQKIAADQSQRCITNRGEAVIWKGGNGPGLGCGPHIIEGFCSDLQRTYTKTYTPEGHFSRCTS